MKIKGWLSTKLRAKLTTDNKINNTLLFLFVIFASVTQSWNLLFSGWIREGRVYFSQFHDSLWHLALIKELARSFPPQHPGMAGIKLENYHYLSDIILSIVYQITGIPAETIYFNLAGPLVAVLFSFGIYKLANELVDSKTKAIIAIPFTVFAGSFAYFIPLFLGLDKQWFANSFMLDQPFDQLTNIHTVLGFGMFLFACFFLVKFIKEKNNKYALLSGLVFGLSTGVKAYAGVVAISGLVITLVIELILKKNSRIWLPLTVSLVLFSIFTILSSATSKPQLELKPGWILTKMIEDPDRFYNEQWIQLSQHYQAAGNYFRIIELNLKKLLVYLIGNLGIRIIGLVYFLRKLIKARNAKSYEIFLISAVIIALIIPIVFVQPISVYNTIQFSPYALILLSIFTLLWVFEQKYSAFLLAILFVLSIPSTLQTFYFRFKPETSLSVSEYESLKHFASLPQSALVLVPPTSDHIYLMKIPGIGGRRTYFSGETFAALTDTNYQDRLLNIKTFFNTSTPFSWREKFLQDAKITHIYSNNEKFSKIIESLDENGLTIIKLYHKDQYTIYQLL